MIDQEKVDELTANQPLNFSDALTLLRYQKQMTRQAWKSSGYITIEKPTLANDGSPRHAHFAFINNDNQGEKRKITLSEIDILAEDWIVYK